MFRHNYAVENRSEMEKELDFLTGHSIYKNSDIAIMPDGHLGKSHACVGFVATYSDKIIVNTVGVDVCCRVSAFKIPEHDIDFEKLDTVIRERVPSGHSIRQKEHEFSQTFPYDTLYCWPDIRENEDRYRKSMGTLGGGKFDCLRAA